MSDEITKLQAEVNRLSAIVEKQSERIEVLRKSQVEKVIESVEWNTYETWSRLIVRQARNLVDPEERLQSYKDTINDLQIQLESKDAALNLTVDNLAAIEAALRSDDETSKPSISIAEGSAIDVIERMVEMADGALKQCNKTEGLTTNQKTGFLGDALSKIGATGTLLLKANRWSTSSSSAARVQKYSELFQTSVIQDHWPDVGSSKPTPEACIPSSSKKSEDTQSSRTKGPPQSTSMAEKLPDWLKTKGKIEVEAAPKSGRGLKAKGKIDKGSMRLADQVSGKGDEGKGRN